MTAVIEGASVSVKTMSDGTLRLSIDIEPRNAQAAFALFGAPGRAVALAALKDGAGAVQEQHKTAGAPQNCRSSTKLQVEGVSTEGSTPPPHKGGAGANLSNSTELEQPDMGNPTSESKTVESHQIAPKGGEWAKQAGMWCSDPDFWMFCNWQFIAEGYGPIKHADDAAELVRQVCDVDSRAEFDNDPSALARFKSRVRIPFMKFMQMRGIRKGGPC